MKVQRLTREKRSEIISVLSASFHDYPVMRFVLRTSGEEYERQLEALIGFFCDIRFVRDWPVLAVLESDGFAAVALINDPVAEPAPLPREQLRQVRAKIGEDAFRRLVAYEKKSSESEPTDPHYFLGMIGVRPDHQGKGYAGVLLNSVREMSEAHPRSGGICLSTETPANVPLYERFGYRVISETDIEELHSWCMFLPTRFCL